MRTGAVAGRGFSRRHGRSSLVERRRVGGPTAGANGDIVRVDVAGGYFVVFSGMRVTRHDGTTFHREGLHPELAVTPTLSGLQAGRDEVLEAGLGVARGHTDPARPRPTQVAAP